jgi:sugar phosphate isomerase/epimerase
MSSVSRREFLEKTAVASAAAGVFAVGAGRLRAKPLGLPIGSQTYPHRQLIADGKFGDLLKELKTIGVETIELCGFLGGAGYPEYKSLADAKTARKVVEDHGLKATSCHFIYTELHDNLAKAIEWSKALGLEQMMIPTLAGPTGANGQPAPTMDDVKRLTDMFNKDAAEIGKAGMRAGIHNEGFELTTINGKRTYDWVIEATDPKLVGFQFQMSTINQGLVAVNYFTKYPGRFFSMHVQDVNMNDPVPQTGRGVRPQRSVGQGTIDWAKTFEAAKTGGVKNYFVEQNMILTYSSVQALKAMSV